MTDRKEYLKKYYQEHKKEKNEYCRNYAKCHRERINERVRERRKDPEYRKLINEKEKHYRIFGTYKLFN